MSAVCDDPRVLFLSIVLALCVVPIVQGAWVSRRAPEAALSFGQHSVPEDGSHRWWIWIQNMGPLPLDEHEVVEKSIRFLARQPVEIQEVGGADMPGSTQPMVQPIPGDGETNGVEFPPFRLGPYDSVSVSGISNSPVRGAWEFGGDVDEDQPRAVRRSLVVAQYLAPFVLAIAAGTAVILSGAARWTESLWLSGGADPVGGVILEVFLGVCIGVPAAIGARRLTARCMARVRMARLTRDA